MIFCSDFPDHLRPAAVQLLGRLIPEFAYNADGSEEAGWRYSDPAKVAARFRAIIAAFRAELPQAVERVTIPFNRMVDCGADGRIVPGAPAHSAFIRRKERLDLE